VADTRLAQRFELVWFADAVRVTDLHGVSWTVRRRWLPRYEGRGLRERLRQRRARSAARRESDDLRWFDVFDLPVVDDSLAGFVVSLLVIVALVLLAVFGVPFLLALVDLVVVVVATALGVTGRVCFRRPWTVEAVSATGERYGVGVIGWRNAGEMVRSLGEDIRHGRRAAGDAEGRRAGGSGPPLPTRP
jgi:hypothetical protein